MSSGTSAAVREKQLVARANRGEEAALEALYEAHRGWVTALAYRFTGSHDDALDVLQETFVYVFSKFPGFELTATMRGFLYPVVKHKSISLIRRRRNVVDLSAFREGRDGRVRDELCWYPAEVSGTMLSRLLADLPQGQREVVWMRFGLEFRLEEIATSLEIPLGTVKSRLHNALKALRISAVSPRAEKNGAGS